MWRRRPGGCTILPAPHLPGALTCTHHAASAALDQRGQHTGRVVPSSRRARRVPCRACARG
eukprot:40222-Prymnesium_polylepis.1